MQNFKFICLLLFTFFIHTNLYADNDQVPPVIGMLKAKTDWIPLYGYNTTPIYEQSSGVAAKFRKDTTFFTLNKKPINGKYDVYVYGLPIVGQVNEQDVEIVPFDSRFQQFYYLMDSYRTRAALSGMDVFPFRGQYRYIDADTIEIGVSNTWNTMQPKYQKKFEEDALKMWVYLNDYEDKYQYCLKFMYQEKELATRCSDKAFIKRESKNGKTFSLRSFFSI